MDKIRVRFAPSPTGYLHVGGLRTALYDYLFARKNGGTFILKIEDTDRKRFVEGAVESLIGSLNWAGLNRDEGVFLSSEIQKDKMEATESKNYPGISEVGSYGPYIQSEKLELYKKYAEQLIQEGKAYYCFCTPERLEEVKNIKIAAKEAPMYDRHCLDLSEEDVENNLKNGMSYVIRMKIPRDREIETEDLIRGKVQFKTNFIDDQVLMKSDGYPTYHLASVIDDHDMQITEVIRGEEWLSSLPKHLILYEYFGWEAPRFAHLPLLLSTDKKKLSKRMGDVAVEDYIKKGYLKEAIINFVALLGWNPGQGSTQEIFSLDELVNVFDLVNVNKSGAVFDLQKLDWMNAQYIKKLSVDELYDLSLEFWQKKEFYNSWNMKHGAWSNEQKEIYLKKVLTIEQDRLVNLAGVGETNQFFFWDVTPPKEMLHWKNMTDEDLKKSLEDSKNILENIADENWTRENIEKLLLEKAGDKRGDLLWPLRASLSGEQKSPSPFELAWVLGREESLKRIVGALGLI